ncbi:uncharacterized protein FFNC_03454 [Fusarium fujikuroi]|nr:uncharacterized protein FFNC_03454 [Fusarium fujikuroi]
MAFLIIILVP